jgi:large subunit ribosomal protein L10
VNRDQKAAVVDEVAADIQSAEAIFAVDYRGMSVTQAAELRGKLIDAQASLRVVKNTLTERAADKAGDDHLKVLLEGPTALTFVNGDVAVAAKVIADFRRANELPEFKGGSMGGEALSAEEITSIAKLPARDVLNAQLAGTIASPLTGLVRGLNALIAGIAIQLSQIAEQGLVGGDAPVEEETASEAPGDPVAEAEAAEEDTSEETPSEGDTAEEQEG